MAAKKLIEKYGFDFLQWVEVPFGYRVSSLLYFLGKNGTDYLNGQYFEFLKTKIKEQSKPNLLDQSSVLGDNTEIVKRPSNLQEFLKT